MARFVYKAYGQDGEPITGEVAAETDADARAHIIRQGAVPYELARADAATRRSSGRAAPKDVLTALRQLSALLRARVGLLDAWAVLASSAPHPDLRSRADAVTRELRAGERLGDAWRKVGPPAPEYVLRLIEAGEKSGALAETLSDSVEQMSFQQKVVTELRGALAYPAFLVFAGLAVTLFILGFVVPRFAEIAASNDADIPGFAALVLTLGVFVSQNFLLVLAGLIALAAGGFLLLKSEGGRATVLNAMSAIPFAARLITDIDMARWAGVVSLSLRHGVHLTEALEQAGSVVASPRRRAQLAKVDGDLREGGALAESLKRRSDIDVSDISIIEASETAGELAEGLKLVSEQRREAAMRRLEEATRFFEPAAITIVAVFVGLIVVTLVLTMTSFYDFAGTG